MGIANLEGTVLDGKYRVERRLGVGGMGAVYFATHLGTSRPVALKVIVPKYAGEASFVDRFRREARAAGRLRHPNIVDVTDFGVTTAGSAEVAYLVMEYLDGCSLEDVLAEDPKLPLRWTVDFFDQFSAAVDWAHRKGIVHRDLKPSNVWLEPNLRGGFVVKVLDFGLAKIVESAVSPEPAPVPLAEELPAISSTAETLRPASPNELAPVAAPVLESAAPAEPAGARSASGSLEAPPDDSALTAVGSVMGTPRYMPPEQAAGGIVGSAADVYSMGVICYEMLAGRPPFTSTDPAVLMREHLETVPPALADVAPDIPRRVSDLVMSALSKAPVERPATAALFADQFRAAAESPGAVLQRGFVTCFEHFRTFLGIGALVVAPGVLLTIARFVVDRLARAGAVSAGTSSVAGAVLWWTDVVVLLLLGLLARGVVTLIIAQIRLAPLREVRPKLAYGALLRYLPATVAAATSILAFTVVPVVLGALAIAWGDEQVGDSLYVSLVMGHDPWRATLGLVAVAGGLVLWGFAYRTWVDSLQLPNVVLAEGLDGAAALRRSRELARRSRADALVVGLVTLAAPALVALLPSALAVESRGVLVALGITLAILGARLLVATVMPVLVAVLYVKLRQANAEPIEVLLAPQFVDEEPPKAAWQRRLDIAPYTSSVARDATSRSATPT